MDTVETVDLHARVVGEGPPILVLHGVFGSGDNWGSFVKPWQDRRTLHLLDLRNHGKSPHADRMDYPALAADVAAYIDRHGLGKVDVIGHSMGGKTGMYLAGLYPDKVQRLAVVDIAPRAYAPHHQRYIAGLRALDPATLTGRAEAEERMAAQIPDLGIRQFLLKSLVRTDVGFAIRMNLDAIEANILNVGDGFDRALSIACPLIFVRGSYSDYIGVRDEQEIRERFPQATIETVEGAGHWVQAEQPVGLAAVLEPFFDIR